MSVQTLERPPELPPPPDRGPAGHRRLRARRPAWLAAQAGHRGRDRLARDRLIGLAAADLLLLIG